MPLAVREQQEDEIDLVELFYLLWGHALQIIACIILGGAAAFAYTYFLVTPLYKLQRRCMWRRPPTIPSWTSTTCSWAASWRWITSSCSSAVR